MSTRVGIVGGGAIGRELREQLVGGAVADCVLQGVVMSRTAGPDAIARLARECDVLVEAAGVDAVSACLAAADVHDCALVVCSTGAFADPVLEQRLRSGDLRDRVFLPAGAIGGLDLLAALGRACPPRSVRLTTTKHPAALGVDVGAPTTVLSGSAREAIARFPRTANVGVTLALTTVGLDATAVTVIADPGATATTHVIEVDSDLGSYRFEITNALAAGSGARTSALTAWSALLTIERAAATRRLRATGSREEIRT